MTRETKKKHRIIVIDDNRAIHEDYKKILVPDINIAALGSLETELFGVSNTHGQIDNFDIDSAYQGQEGFELVKKAIATGLPYSLAFVDMRMPPGWDGIETIEHIWQADPELQIVICSAYSDHSWSEISQRLGSSDKLLILKKPFDNVEIIQMAHAMCQKCTLTRLEQRLMDLDAIVRQQTSNNPTSSSQDHQELGELKSQLEKILIFVGTLDNELGVPIQDLQDSSRLLKNAFGEIINLTTNLQNAVRNIPENAAKQALLAQLDQVHGNSNLSYIQERVPETFKRLESALDRIGNGISNMQNMVKNQKIH
ncbi:MAG: response regulator [Gammaproteobacteria bacterium]|nr:response regulator [Gammaproteobacteria bacterium]